MRPWKAETRSWTNATPTGPRSPTTTRPPNQRRPAPSRTWNSARDRQREERSRLGTDPGAQVVRHAMTADQEEAHALEDGIDLSGDARAGRLVSAEPGIQVDHGNGGGHDLGSGCCRAGAGSLRRRPGRGPPGPGPPGP